MTIFLTKTSTNPNQKKKMKKSPTRSNNLNIDQQLVDISSKTKLHSPGLIKHTIREKKDLGKAQQTISPPSSPFNSIKKKFEFFKKKGKEVKYLKSSTEVYKLKKYYIRKENNYRVCFDHFYKVPTKCTHITNSVSNTRYHLLNGDPLECNVVALYQSHNEAQIKSFRVFEKPKESIMQSATPINSSENGPDIHLTPLNFRYHYANDVIVNDLPFQTNLLYSKRASLLGIEQDPDDYNHLLDTTIPFWKKKKANQEIYSAHNEICEYLPLENCNNGENISFWKDVSNQKRFPVLFSLIRDYLATPCSSVEVERTFSNGKNIVTHKRHHLKDSTIESCVLLKEWNHQIQAVVYDVLNKKKDGGVHNK
ncbi:hypothetical protein DICPUDRAFT_74148 [Dictyostelium purpureum]|uniref:HAT C-terminal dimerisation domain-containing protein n=1 Tax=Dictyostelium purpureum TaxID=5786 RepID=F0Z6X4_DICPU|nr:uncharacterized protein DICPUDRAFT_74148 [Dictyostelium purpureum]EGC40281.1 hypothetical protein DICPUDRAFT_74148 [Dictyostelium purpureum]|eukprot:XP_003283217.1 hypothetical protein DICPUDRAFT_74148 [Dictyostelium purpureum]